MISQHRLMGAFSLKQCSYHQFVDDIAAFTRHYEGDDYVVIWGGIFDVKTTTAST